MRVACDELNGDDDVVIGDDWRSVRAVQCADVASLDAAMQRAIDVAELLACFDALLFEAHNDLLTTMLGDADLQTALRGVSADDWAQSRAEFDARADRLLSTSDAQNSAAFGDDLWSVRSELSSVTESQCAGVLSGWSSAGGAATRQTTATSVLTARLAQIEARLRQAPASLVALPPAGGVAISALSDSLSGVRWSAAVADDALLLLDAVARGVASDVFARVGALGNSPTSSRAALPLHISDGDRPSAQSQPARRAADFAGMDASSSSIAAPPLLIGVLLADVSTGTGVRDIVGIASSLAATACSSALTAGVDVPLCGAVTGRADLVSLSRQLSSSLVVIDSDAATVLNAPTTGVVLRQPLLGADKTRVEAALSSFRNRTVNTLFRLLP